MTDDDLSPDALGLDAPDRPLPKRERTHVVDFGLEAVAKRQAEAKLTVAIAPVRSPRQRRNEAETRAPHFKLQTPDQIRARPALPWLMRYVLPAAGFGALYGPSGCGKSFLQLDMLAALAEHADWFGYRVRKACRIVCVVLEGQDGIRNRIAAWESHHGRPYPENVRFVFETFRILEREHLLSLALEIERAGGCDLLLIDTLNRAAPGVDENGPQDAGRLLDAMRELQLLTGGLVLVTHHSGKNIGAGMRGHSSLFAGMDVVIACSRSGDSREWSVEKAKDGPEGKPHAFKLHGVDLGNDDDGEPITSCVVLQPDAHEAIAEVRHPLPRGGNQKIVYDALLPLFRASAAFGRAGAPPVRPCIALDDAIAATRDRLTVEPKRRTERARQAITGLVSMGSVRHNEGWLWLP